MLAGGMAQYCRSADHPCATPGDALLEIKTDFSNANTRAGRRICDTRAEQVPGEYQRRAASCDQRWGVGRAFRDRLAATKLLPVAFDRYGGCSKSMEELVRIMSAAGAERLAGQYGVSAGVNATGVLAWSAKRKMARLYHADLAELAWARYDKVTVQASVPGAVVHVSVPVEVVTLLRRRRAVEPTRTDGLGARLGAVADDELAVVEHVARPGDPI